MMSRIIANIKSKCHGLFHLMKLQITHREIKHGISYQLLGISVWFKSEKIECSCGKQFLNKLS